MNDRTTRQGKSGTGTGTGIFRVKEGRGPRYGTDTELTIPYIATWPITAAGISHGV